MELPGGVATPGIYDHRPYLASYGLPADMRGKTVLDVGAASGFFTFELERRGARVTRAWNTLERPAWLATGPAPRPPRPAPQSWDARLAASEREVERLHGVVNAYQRMKFAKLVQWLHPYRERTGRLFR